MELFSALVDGSAAPIRLNDPLTAPNSVSWHKFGIEDMVSPDGRWILYRLSHESGLFSVPIDRSAPPLNLSALLAYPDEWGRGRVISPDSQWVAFGSVELYDDLFGGIMALWRAPLDGVTPPTLLADITVDQARPWNVAISPDSERIIYTTLEFDAITSHEKLISIDTAGDAPVDLTHPSVPGGATNIDFQISPDSKWVVYAADQTISGVRELFSTPTDRAESRPLNTRLPADNNGRVTTYALTTDDQSVVYIAERGGDDTSRLYRSSVQGGEPPSTLVGDKVRDGSGGQFEPGTLLVSPNGLNVICAVETWSTTYSWVFAYLDGITSPEYIGEEGSGFMYFEKINPLLFSLDGNFFIYSKHLQAGGGCYTDEEGAVICSEEVHWDWRFIIDFRTGEKQDISHLYPEFFALGNLLVFTQYENLYVAPADNLSNYTNLNGSVQVSAPMASSSGRNVVFRGYLSGANGLYSVPVNGSRLPLPLTPAWASFVDNRKFVLCDEAARLVYIADQDSNNLYELFSVPADGSMQSVKLSSTLVAEGDVEDFVLSADSTRIVYFADQDADEVRELYSVPIDGSAAPVKLNGVLPLGGDVKSYLLSRDGRHVVYRADQDMDEVFDLYAAPIDGTTPPIKLNGPLMAGGNVVEFAISTDSRWVSYRADQETDEVFELYSVPISGGEAVKRSLPGTETDGAGLWAGDRLVYKDTTDDEDGQGLYSSVILGPKATVSKAVGQVSATNMLPIRFDIVFDEPVSGLDASYFVNDGTAAGVQFALSQLTPTHYAFDAVAAEGDGTIIPRLLAGVVTGAFGRPNPDSTGLDHVVLLDRTPPVITIMETSPFRLACTGVYVPRGATALDAIDGAVPVSRVSDPVNPNIPGEYDVVYEASDQLGNAGYATLRVEVVDTTPPTLTLLGDTLMRVHCGDAFTDPGATAEDVCAGALTVAVSGNVDTSNAGLYTLTYTADDGNGHVVTAQRHVDVRCDCLLSNVQVLYPPDGATIRTAVQDTTTLTLQAATDCREDTASLEFYLDGETFSALSPSPWTGRAGVGSSMGYYSTRVSGIIGSPTGTPHTLNVKASNRFGGTLTATSTFTVFTATGLQPNGLPLTPLADLLPQDGDSFYSEAELSPGCVRSIGMLAWDADTQSTAPVTLELMHPDAPDSPVRVAAPRALLEPDERGILLFLLGCDSPDTTLDEGIENIDTPPGELSIGARYLFVTVLTSADGVNFADIDPLRLAENPLHVECQGIETTSNREPALFTHPGETLFDPMAVAGVQGIWTEAQTAEKSPDTAYLAADVSETGLMAIFDVDPKGPCLRVTPSPQFPVQLGLVRVGETLETSITIENTGTGLLEGVIALEAGPEFTLTGPTNYRLGPGERTVAGNLVVRYTPASTDTRTATVIFTSTGDGDPARTNATLTLIGNGATTPKPFNILGCGADPASPAMHGTALALLTATTLLLRYRRSRHNRPPRGTTPAPPLHHQNKW